MIANVDRASQPGWHWPGWHWPGFVQVRVHHFRNRRRSLLSSATFADSLLPAAATVWQAGVPLGFPWGFPWKYDALSGAEGLTADRHDPGG